LARSSVPVQTLLGYVEEGDTLGQILKRFSGRESRSGCEIPRAGEGPAHRVRILIEECVNPRLLEAFPEREVVAAVTTAWR
jgi:hypothetical protein